MLKRIICILVLVFTCSVYGQNVVKHTVAAGETIQAIAQKYKVTPYDIYKLNPDSQSGIKVNSVLLIPKSTGKAEVKSDVKTDVKPTTKPTPKVPIAKAHTVVAKETFYSITKMYNVTQAELEANNPFLKTDGLQPGQVLIIHRDPVVPKYIPSSNATSIHEVLPKETKYGIATKYGMTVAELEKLNPEIVENLPIGFQLKVKKGATKPEVVVPAKEPVTTPKITLPVQNSTLTYTVKSGETLYSLSNLFNLSQEKLIAMNPELKDGVREGMVLNVPQTVTFAKNNEYFDLSKTISNSKKKKLVLMLPFNAAKIQNDTLNSFADKLKKDKFLNMTLDFYSGVLMAIDSAKTLNLNIDVKIFDSKETKNATSAIDIINANNLENADAIIGPFYQDNVEKVAAFLESKNVAVISPLSKESAKSYSNLYQSMPINDASKDAIFNYMRAKNGNIIAVVNPKKNSIKEYLAQNQSNIHIVGVAENGSVVADSIRKYFVKDKMNYVVMETEKTAAILSITNTMLAAQKDYQLQLVILGENPTLDYEEIALSRLTKLKLLYPSLTNDTESANKASFEKEYKLKNKIFPSAYATRGFDIMLDTMLRLSQDKTFEETAQSMASEQLENKFDYRKKIDGGFINKGNYILYYDTDLSIQKAP